MAGSKPTIACFGATGGCVGAALACALRDGYHCTALARSPEKLRELLTTKHGVAPTSIGQYLTIHQGDATDPIAVTAVLTNPCDNSLLVDVILSGLGAYPNFQWSVVQPLLLSDPTICERAIATIYSAISNFTHSSPAYSTRNVSQKMPLLVVISTAGAGRRRGLPLSIFLPYHYLLSSPLADKVNMEKLIFEDEGRHVRDFVIIRPPFLSDGQAKGIDSMRIGWEWGVAGIKGRVEEPGPQIGYHVGKSDVGA